MNNTMNRAVIAKSWMGELFRRHGGRAYVAVFVSSPPLREADRVDHAVAVQRIGVAADRREPCIRPVTQIGTSEILRYGAGGNGIVMSSPQSEVTTSISFEGGL
jgi:hypothetical protein